MSRIVKVRKNTDGDITHVMLDDEKQITINQAIRMANKEQLENVTIGKAKNGTETLRSSKNSNQEDNLSNLPTFE